MPEQKTIGFVFIEGFADWEYGLLAASAVEWFGAKAVSVSPNGKPVTSMSGFKLTPDRSTDPAQNVDIDGVAVIGSDNWAAKNPPDVAPLLDSVGKRGGVVGGICAGTLALARAGLFRNAGHTSNGRDWILGHEPNYAGAANYRDVPHAVADGKVVSAPGSAPGTFAVEFLRAVYPDKEAQFVEMRALFGSEYAAAS
jgi:putative intracellular protease/amidase